MIPWWVFLGYGLLCVLVGYVAGDRSYSVVGALRALLNRRKPRPLEDTKMTAMLREIYPLSCRDEALRRRDIPTSFGKLTKAPRRADTTWVVPISMLKDKDPS